MSGASTRPVMRDHSVHERPATPLELFFDLCFVVAVAFLAITLDEGVVDGEPVRAVLVYAGLFVPIWWAWMSYTWYATAFSHDDAITRVLTFVQMGGILAVAAAVPGAAEGDLVPFTIAYALMRLPLVVQWLRSAAADPEHRGFALTYAGGSVVAQLLWVTGAVAPTAGTVVLFGLAIVAELITPTLAVRRAPGRVFHPRHIAERYGLFTIIVLGETVLATATGLKGVVDTGDLGQRVVGVVVFGLAVAALTWWLYFDSLDTAALERNRAAAFAWGYGHYAVFAAVAAVGAGIAAEVHAYPPEQGHGAVVVAGAVAITLATLAAMRRAAGGNRLSPLVVGAFAAAASAPLGPMVGPVLALAAVAAIVGVVLVAGAVASEPEEAAVRP